MHRGFLAHAATRLSTMGGRLPADEEMACACVFEEMVHDLRVVLRLARGRVPHPTAAVLDSRTLRSTPESGSRAGNDRAKCK